MRPVALAAGLLVLLAVAGGEGVARSVPSPGTVLFLHGGFSRPSIEIVRADGKGRPRVLARHAFEPSWSPDGKQIAYVRPGVDSGVIYLMQANGAGKHVLTGGGFEPAWSRDGTRIAYSGFDVAPHGIGVLNRLGRGFRRVTDGDDDSPAWSPDGREIAFHHQIPDLADRERMGFAEIHVVNSDGSGERTVAKQVLGGFGSGPQWSRHGAKIAGVGRVSAPGERQEGEAGQTI